MHMTTVHLTQTDKRATRDHKSNYIQQVRDAVDNYNTIYLFNYENMRSNKFKDVRLHFREDSRIFLGKNKLLQIALGRTPEEEYSDNLRHLAKGIEGGSVGVLMTSKTDTEVEAYFSSLSEPDYARAGARAEAEVSVTEEQMSGLPVSMMEQLRKLGMPVEIRRGKVVFRDGQASYRICKKGDVLSAEQCKLLKHFDIKLVNFQVKLLCRWSDSEFVELNSGMDES
jgi:mRNA turnover protein 4